MRLTQDGADAQRGEGGITCLCVPAHRFLPSRPPQGTFSCISLKTLALCWVLLGLRQTMALSGVSHVCSRGQACQ